MCLKATELSHSHHSQKTESWSKALHISFRTLWESHGHPVFSCLLLLYSATITKALTGNSPHFVLLEITNFQAAVLYFLQDLFYEALEFDLAFKVSGNGKKKTIKKPTIKVISDSLTFLYMLHIAMVTNLQVLAALKTQHIPKRFFNKTLNTESLTQQGEQV